MKTSELIGLPLDWAVAVAEGYTPFTDGISWIVDRGGNYVQVPEYSTLWSEGGPIIEQEGIDLLHCRQNDGSVCWDATMDSGESYTVADTPLIAAMRCFVASKLGDDINTPEELCP